jgi:hypothetical protein
MEGITSGNPQARATPINITLKVVVNLVYRIIAKKSILPQWVCKSYLTIFLGVCIFGGIRKPFEFPGWSICLSEAISGG